MTVEIAVPSPGRARLHITPFNPDLLDRILPASLRPSARNISFHTVQTFPERGFGFVDLPVAEAQNLKKKLNGATLRGMKIRVEDAKLEQKRKPDGGQAESNEQPRKKAKRCKTSQVQGVLPGYELQPGRSVQRGWTSAGDDAAHRGRRPSGSKDTPSRTTSSAQHRVLQFKTRLPPASQAIQTEIDGQKKPKERKGRKTKSDKSYIQEFAKSTKLKASASDYGTSKRAVSYENGKGWVDESGDIVQREHQSARWNRESHSRVLETSEPVASVDRADDAAGNGARDASSSIVEASDLTTPSDQQSTASMSDSEDTDESDSEPMPSATQDSGSKTPPRVIHPLEALFKRPAVDALDTQKPKPPTIDTAFSFFDAVAHGDDDDAMYGVGDGHAPQTPHTVRDLEGRGVRSAAPTPDTAAIGRHSAFSNAEEDGDSSESDAVTGQASIEYDTAGGSNGDEPVESAFRKWFYENRGDLNRKWKACRREELKVKKKRENKRLNRKVA